MTFNIWTFLFEIVNFVVLAYILHRVLYRPLRAAIERRRAAIAQAQADAEKARDEALAMQKQLESQLADTERQRHEALQKTRELAEAERQRLIAEAEKVVERRQEDARAAIERQRQDSLKSLRAEVNAAAAELAERLLREAAGTSLQQQLARRLVDSLTTLPETERARVRNDWKASDAAVVETAAALDSTSLEEINRAVEAVVGQKVKLAVETRPALVAGARLRIGGRLWDASLAGQLEALRAAGANNRNHG
jgi:F-type H+-transporting ATPase subunit b